MGGVLGEWGGWLGGLGVGWFGWVAGVSNFHRCGHMLVHGNAKSTGALRGLTSHKITRPRRLSLHSVGGQQLSDILPRACIFEPQSLGQYFLDHISQSSLDAQL